MFSRFKWFGVAAAVVFGLVACELTLSLAFAPSLRVLSPASYSVINTNFTISGTVSDNGKAVDGVFVKLGSSGSWTVVSGTENLATANDTPWSYNVTISSIGTGYKTFYFKATSGDLESVQYSKTIYIGAEFDEVEPNDTLGAADAVSLSVLYDALMSENDQDWFSFTVITPGTYRIETTNSTINGGPIVDTVVFLYDNVGTIITSNDNNVGWQYFSRVSSELTAGGYYYKVVGKGSYPTGAYAHKVYFIP